eukprot:10144477-Alexandrium_andersonii.AAC.1
MVERAALRPIEAVHEARRVPGEAAVAQPTRAGQVGVPEGEVVACGARSCRNASAEPARARSHGSLGGWRGRARPAARRRPGGTRPRRSP